MRECSRVAVLVVALLLAGFCSASAFAQELATLSGRITDPNGLAVPGVKVRAVNVLTNSSYSGETNDVGLYNVSSLPPGTYRIFVEKQGFAQVVKPALELHVADIIALNFGLRVGSVTETVTVEAGAPLINTESAAVSTLVDRNFVANMPLNGRSFQSLLELTPGVVDVTTNSNNQGQFSVNGQRADANYFTVDGVSANASIGTGGAINTAGTGSLPITSAMGGYNNLVSIDALQEFRIETSGFAPEYGRTPGAQVMLLTRSGANQLHGTAFDYLRNDALDANDWFANHAGLPKPPVHQNDFGAVLGGPIVKNRVFFFASYEGLRLHQQVTTSTSTPTVQARTTAAAAIRPFLNAYPIPNPVPSDPPTGDPLIGIYHRNLPRRNQLDAGSIRTDYRLNDRMTLFGRYNYSPTDVVAAGAPSDTILSLNLHTITMGYTYTITPVLVNDLRFNYTHLIGSTAFAADPAGGAIPVPNNLLFPGNPYTSTNTTIQFSPSPFNGLLAGTQVGNRQRQWNITDSVSWQKGTHQVKVGFDFRQLTPTLHQALYQITSNFDSPSDWFNGVANQARVSVENDMTLRLREYSTYVQDTWRMNPRTTVTYGVRWDVNPAPGSAGNTIAPFALNQFDPANVAATRALPLGAAPYKTTWGNFAPRIGIAYQLSQNPKWSRVLRGGFGIFYDDAGEASGFIFGPIDPSSNFNNVPYPLNPAQLTVPPPNLTPPYTTGHEGQTTDPNLKLPYVYQFNVSVQQALGSSQNVSATYVGAIGRRLIRAEGYEATNTDFPGGFTIIRNTGTSDYHALQVQYQMRISHGLQILGGYVWAHSIDNASNYSVSLLATSTAVANPNIDRGSSNFDIRHAFNAAVSYSIPGPKGGSLSRALFSGWGIDLINHFRSAPPINVRAGNVHQNNTVIIRRPDVVPGQPFYLFGAQCTAVFGVPCPGGKGFNPAAFKTPARGAAQGTLGRNVLRTFAAEQMDFALRRTFAVTERIRLEIRGDVFNIFNHPNFADEAFRTNEPGFFGRSQSMLANQLGSGDGTSGGFNPLYNIGGPRSVQLAAKIHF